MIIKTIEKSSIVNNINNNIGLCYFDPETEQLTEISDDSLVHLMPFESNVRRYYLVKTSDILFGKRFDLASITIRSKNPKIEVKVCNGVSDRITEPLDFYDIEINNDMILYFNEYPSGIMPIDIFIKSTTNETIDTSFDINIRLI